MGCKGADEVADEVIGFVGVVVRFHVVEANQQFIDVLGRAKQEISRSFGDDEILWEELEHLFVVFQRRPTVIVRVSETVQGFPRDTNFAGRKVRGWYIAHVVANRTVPEHRQLVLGTEDAFLDGFRCLVSTVQFLHAFDLRRQAVNPETDTGIFHHFVHPNRLDLAPTVSVGFRGVGGGWATAGFAGFALAVGIQCPMVAAEVWRFLAAG